jgi:hypothetical protein
VQVPWSELADTLAQILMDDALERAAQQDINLDLAMVRQAARRRAAELVGVIDAETAYFTPAQDSIAETTRRILRELTADAIRNDATPDKLRERILNSPAFSKARAQVLLG